VATKTGSHRVVSDRERPGVTSLTDAKMKSRARKTRRKTVGSDKDSELVSDMKTMPEQKLVPQYEIQHGFSSSNSNKVHTPEPRRSPPSLPLLIGTRI
jgi:hypothetical protein